MARLSYLHLFAMKRRDCSWPAGIPGLLGKTTVGRKSSLQQPLHAALRSPLLSSLPRACSPGRHFPLCYATSCHRKQDWEMQPSPLHLSWRTYRLPAMQTHGWGGVFCACSKTSGSPLNPGRFAQGRGVGLMPFIQAAKPSSRRAEMKSWGSSRTLNHSKRLQSKHQSQWGCRSSAHRAGSLPAPACCHCTGGAASGTLGTRKS